MSYGAAAIGTRAIGGGAPAGEITSSSYSRAASDNAIATDAATRIGIHPRSGSATASATDTVIRVGVHPRSGSEAAPATDVGTRVVVSARGTASDNAPAADAPSRTGVFHRSPTDSAPAVDVPTRTRIFSRTAFDGAPAVDTPSRTGVFHRSPADSAPAVGDTSSILLVAQRWEYGIGYSYENVGVETVAVADAVGYGYLGDVNSDQPTPHLWYLTPDFVDEGAGMAVSVVGTGFGDTEQQYLGSIFLDEVQLPAIQVIGWNAVADDGATESVIDSANDVADPAHQRIQFLVPFEQETANVTVHTRVYVEDIASARASDSAPAVETVESTRIVIREVSEEALSIDAGSRRVTAIRSASDSAPAVDTATGIVNLGSSQVSGANVLGDFWGARGMEFEITTSVIVTAVSPQFYTNPDGTVGCRVGIATGVGIGTLCRFPTWLSDGLGNQCFADIPIGTTRANFPGVGFLLVPGTFYTVVVANLSNTTNVATRVIKGSNGTTETTTGVIKNPGESTVFNGGTSPGSDAETFTQTGDFPQVFGGGQRGFTLYGHL